MSSRIQLPVGEVRPTAMERDGVGALGEGGGWVRDDRSDPSGTEFTLDSNDRRMVA